MLNCFITRPTQEMIPIKPLVKSTLDSWLAAQDPYLQQWVKSSRFSAEAGEICLVPSPQGRLAQVLVGQASPDDFWVFGDLPTSSPANIVLI